jgi:hypothetical protein
MQDYGPNFWIRAARSRSLELELSIRMAMDVLQDQSKPESERIATAYRYLRLFLPEAANPS